MYHLLTATISMAVISSCVGYPFGSYYAHHFLDLDTPDASDLMYLHGNTALTGTAVGGVPSSAGTVASHGSANAMGLFLGHGLCDARVCRLRGCPDEMIQPTGMCICKSDMCDVNPFFFGGSFGQRSTLNSGNIVG
ncbi:hypothetical protein CHS0354_020926 [Potamilus streckersoni]|uniref:Secreted protein n=1 Tax=Potamilus streckersoni TaxID=2493646 RepID=A0AAE0SVG8_9BIVA|nr:hypothetical protein CHS0354_020926 [Potamilus streckersoni]